MAEICYGCFQEKEGTGVCPACGYDAAKDREKYPLALPCGTVLGGRYILGRVLGQGGFGITYLAQSYKDKKLCAIKEYFPDTMATRTGGHTVTAFSGQRGESFQYGKSCFLEEAKTLAEFNGNEHIVRVHRYFEENGTAYFAMDYVEGVSLQSYVREHGGRLSWQEAMKFLLPVMHALEEVHAKGIIHRDVTPDNIVITVDGTVKLLDFGAARYSLGDKSQSLDVVLKHGFAPKEQYTRRGRQGPYTDVYSVAASFYYTVTGRIPPDSIDRMEEDELLMPGSLGVNLPRHVEEALYKGLAVQAADRYQSMGAFAAALEGNETAPEKEKGLTEDPSAKKREGFAPRLPKKIPKPALYGAGLALLATVILIAVFSGGHGETPATAGTAVPAVKTDVSDPSGSVSSAEDVPQLSGSVSLVTEDAGQEQGEKSGQTELRSLRTKCTYYEDDGSLDYYTETDYNEYGEETEWRVFNPDGSIDYWHEYEYDAQGNQVRDTRFDADSSATEYDEYTYDENGNKLKYQSFDADGSLDVWSEYIYNELGQKVAYYYHGISGESGYEYTYDSAGNQIEYVRYDDGIFDGRSKYEYDSEGREIRHYSYNESDELDYWTETSYDTNGNPVLEYSYEADGSFRSKNERGYDARGNCVSSKSYYKDPSTPDYIATYKYSYDRDGNMLREEYYYENKLRSVDEYQITEVKLH